MANKDIRIHRHFLLKNLADTETYASPRSRSQVKVPERDRKRQSQALLEQLTEIRTIADSVRNAQQTAGLDEKALGLQIEFESFPNIDFDFKRLARERQGIEIRNVRDNADKTQVTVFVPDGKLAHFEKLIRDYLEFKTDKAGRPRDNRLLIDAIHRIRQASLRALWTDTPEAFPSDEHKQFWWEAWLPRRLPRSDGKTSSRDETNILAFRREAEIQGMQVAREQLYFPERTVLLVRTSSTVMRQSAMILNSVAELRRAKETADFFDSLPIQEQQEWLDDLLARVRVSSEHKNTPYVCLLDTGINRGHPLIAPFLSRANLYTVEPGWGTDDQVGHGTKMAGLAIAGNLTDLLAGTEDIEINHQLESVKLLPNASRTSNSSQHHGYLTIQAVARPESVNPFRKRVFGMAVTCRDNRDRGRPSAWSSALDFLASDTDDSDPQPRLLIVSAGNVEDLNAWINYPYSNETDGVHDPSQAWNALTVGAYTDLISITERDAEGYAPIAAKGGLSPFSTTSVTWQNNWPLKPDIVLEGGNAAKGILGAVSTPSLSLLTTNNVPTQRLFTTANATSVATALTCRLAAQIRAVYPELWPETVRALIVHSSEWTATMKKEFLPNKRQSKADYVGLIQRCGFGVPSLDRSLWSVRNSLVMVVEDSLRPFEKIVSTGRIGFCDMQLHHLPWPQSLLESIGEMQVEMRVTLSYFIEPNPSRRGIHSRYRYESHGLRFDVKRPLETIDQFRSRINTAVEKTARHLTHSEDSGWLIGMRGRQRGSLNSDIWKGSGADLASRGIIAVFPTTGWWKTRPALGGFDRTARYALIVSINASDVDVDLYTEVANLVGIDTPIGI